MTSYVAGGIEGVVETSISNVDQMVLNALSPGEGGWVNEFVRTELACPRLLTRVCVDRNDPRGTDESRSSDNTETNGATPEDSDRRAL